MMKKLYLMLILLSACQLTHAQISGIVFRDFNANGVRSTTNPIEPLLANVTVIAYNAAGVPVDTVITSSVGAYSFTGLTLPLRIEFTGLDSSYYTGPSGTGNASSVQFYTAASTTANFGVNYPADYCQSTNPNMLTMQYTNGNPLGGGTAGSRRGLITFDYNSSGNATGDPDLNSLGYTADPVTYSNPTSTTGPVWGIAYQRSKKRAFAAAFIKRHQGIGPLGEGGIYTVDYSGGGAPVISNFIDVNTIGINTGVVGTGATPTLRNTSRGLSNVTTTPNPSGDPLAFDAVGKVGLGDLDISDDESTLYVINLFDQKLYAILIDADNNPSTPPTSSDVTSYTLPTNPCSSGTLRPFAVKFYRGNVYVGAVCDGSLQAFIYKLDGSSFVSVPVDGANAIPLTYTKGQATSSTGCNTAANNGWFTWSSTPQAACNGAGSGDEMYVRPTPILCDIEFDVDGSMIVSFMDRSGHQFGAGNTQFDGSGFETVHSGGDILRICNIGGNFVMQGASGCANNAANAQGPNGGEFYNQDLLNFPAGGGLLHQETTIGGMALLPGRNEVAVTCFDPYGGPFLAGGVNWFNNTTGASRTQGYFVYFGTTGSLYNSGDFSKAAGMGDIELLCDAAPIEIGNRVWLDTDLDGIQDANEPGLASIPVQLFKGSTQVGTTTTDANGNYYFNNANVTMNGATGITPNTAYEIRLNTGSFLVTALNTDGSPNGDARDNDASGTTTAVIAFTSGYAGQNNHTYDFGLVCSGVINIAANYTAGTCSATSTVPSNTASLQIVTSGDKVAMSTTGIPTTTYAAANTVVSGSYTYTAQNGTVDSFYVRVWSGSICFKDTIIKVTPVHCCPAITFGTPANNTAYCSGATIPSLAITTNAISPDSIQYYLYSTQQSSYNNIINGGGTILGTVKITGTTATSLANTAPLTNVVLPTLFGTTNDTLYIYAVHKTSFGDTICKIYTEKPIILKPQPTASISGVHLACNATAVTLTSGFASTYKWGKMPAVTTLATTANYSPTPTANSSNTYWLVVTNSGTCVSDTVYHTVVASGGIVGTAFRDFNSDGIINTNETYGFGNIKVKLFNNSGALIDSTLTDDDGRYSFPTAAVGMGQLRVEFVKSSFPANVQESFSGTGNGTDVQFVTAPDCNVNLGLKIIGDYCQTNPRIVIPIQNATRSIASSLYASATASAAEQNDATVAQTGIVWGAAYRKANKNMFFATELKRHTMEGPQGMGGIYVFDYSGTPTLTNSFTLQGVSPVNGGANIDLGTVNRVSTPTTSDFYCGASMNIASRDLDAFANVGKKAFGDIDIDETGNNLWMVNLNQRALIKMDVSGTIPGTVSQYPIIGATGVPSCTNGELRPWGLAFRNGKGYLGVVCDASVSQNKNDLAGYVLSFDPNNLSAGYTVELSIPLDYQRETTEGFALSPGSNPPRFDASWRPWVDTYAQTGLTTAGGRLNYSQPIISDIEFLEDGSMVLGLTNRFSEQIGYQNRIPISGSNALIEMNNAGDIIKASYSNGAYFLEGSAECPVGDLGVITTDGFAKNGEYYFGEAFTDGTNTHPEIANGSLAVIKGRKEIISSSFDPVSIFGQGIIFLNNATGARNDQWQVDVNSIAGKGNAIGDVEILCDEAPIQIGNYVWVDLNNDGVQDPNEPPVTNVVVSLWKGGTQIASVPTDANGEYYFSENSVAGVTWTGTGADTTLLPNTAYEVKINLNTFNGYQLTSSNSTNNNGNDQSDNDATLVGNFATIGLATGAMGTINHTYDFGLTCSGAITITPTYTAATCPATGTVANNNASLQITTTGDKVAMSTTGTPTTLYAAANTVVSGSYTYTAQNGLVDSFWVRVWSGPVCYQDTIIVVTPARCCPAITFGTPANNTAYCSGATIASIVSSTNAKSPDQIKYYLYSTQQTTYNGIVSGGGILMGTANIVGTSSTTATNTATLSNYTLPNLLGSINDTMYIYAVYYDASGDTTCKVFGEKPIVLKPQPTASINGLHLVCNATAVSLTSGYATTYRWGKMPAATTLATTQTYSPTPTASSSNTYWLVVTNSGACASDTVYHTVVASGGIVGTAFRDFNSDGIINTNETYGFANIKVKLFNNSGALIDSTLTDDDGRYSFPTAAAGMGQLRVEFVKSSFPVNVQESFSGTGNGTDVQFVTAPDCNVNLGLKQTSDFCGTNPKIVTPIFIDGASATNTTGLNEALYSLNYSDYLNKVTEATRTEIGSTWGVAYSKKTKQLFSAAFLKRHVGLKDGKLGQIYVTDMGTTGTPTTAWLDVSTLGLSGNWQFILDAARGLGNAGTPSKDSVAFSQIAQTGLGDIDISEDETQLYAMDLINKQLLVIDIATKALVGAYPVPSVCSGNATPSYYAANAQTFIATDGKLWKNGYYFNTDNGGLGYTQTITNPNNVAAGTTDAALYATSVYNNVLNYQFPLGSGSYSVKLHLATNGLPNNTNFNVLAEGTTVFSNVNVYAEAGNVINKAVTKTFTTTVTDGILDIRLAGNAGTLVLISGFEITPTSSQPSGQTRPFAIKPYKGKVYIGSVCDASGSQDMSDLNGGIFEFNPQTNTFNSTPVLTIPLNYAKGALVSPSNDPKRWFPWTSVYPNNTPSGISTGAGGFDIYNQPVLSDIEFDLDGSMILGFFDRMGHQMAANVNNYKPNGQLSGYAAVAGDLLRAYYNGSNYELENNAKEGTSSTKSPTAGVNNNQGPGGGEFYFGDNTGGDANGGGAALGHYEILMGGLAFLPGSGEIRATAGDPLVFSSGGFAGFNNITGAKQNGFTLYNGVTAGVQLKSNGLGDLEILCSEPPLQIGNYVWFDGDNDGIQDPNESPMANIVVSLWKAGTQIASTTTNASGEYYFSSKAPLGALWTGTGADTTLLPNTAYELRVNMATYPSNILTLSNSTLATANDQNDNDATLISGYATIPLTTGDKGTINHTYDFGFNCTAPTLTYTYTQALTCTGITPSNNATLQITSVGSDKVAMSTTGIPTTLYSAATALVAGSFTFTAQNGLTDSFYVRVWNGATCFKDSLIVVKPKKCCPTINAITVPASNTAYCAGASIPAFNVSTNAINPDSIRLVYFTSAQTDPYTIYNGPILDQKIITGVAASNNTANFTNVVLPTNTTGASDTLWIYAIYIDHTDDTTCKIFQSKPIIREPQQTQVIYGYDKICSGGSVTLTTNGAVTYQWGSVTPPSSTLGTTQSITVTPTAPTTYWVKGTNTMYGCSSDTAFFTVTPGSGIYGTVYYDFNANGIQDANEHGGVTNITVRAYDSTGALIGTSTTNALGRYNISNATPAMGKLRVEFDKTTFPSGFNSSFNGTSNGTDVQFVTATECAASLGLFQSGQYCQNSPNMALVSFQRNNAAGTTNMVAMMGYNNSAIPFTPTQAADNNYNWGLPNNSSPLVTNYPIPTQTTIANYATVGTTFGLGWDRTNKQLYTGAYMRAYANMGTNTSSNGFGEGIIYAVPINGSTVGTPATWLDLETLLGNDVSGTYVADAVHPGPTIYGRTGSNPNKIGYTGLGSIKVSDDGTQLYVVNLAVPEVLVIPIGPGGTAPTSASAIKRFPFPTTDIPAGSWSYGKPYMAALGLGVHPVSGKVFATLTATGPTVNNLKGIVYSLDPNDATPSSSDFVKEIEIPMNIVRPSTNVNVALYYDMINHPWEAATANSIFYNNNGDNFSQHTQPVLSEVIFDRQPDGNYAMTIGERNRFHDLINGSFYVAGGVAYKVTSNGSSWTLESNGSALPLSTSVNWTNTNANTAGSNTSAINRFYRMSGVEGTFSAGTLGHIPGSNEVVTPAMDNVYFNGGSGIAWLSTINGNRTKNSRLLSDGTVAGYNANPFTKANNYGDIEPLCGEAPLQIGNYVWYDKDQDGVQDPNETPLNNVALTLWKGATQIASTTTNVKGEYYFSKTGVAGVTWTGTGADTTLLPNTSYEVRLLMSQPSIATPNYSLTQTNSSSGNDQNDNDATVISGSAVIPLTTGAAGSINHTYDFGFSDLPSCIPPNAGSDVIACTNSCINITGTLPTTGTWSAHPANASGATLGATAAGIAEVCFTASASGDYYFIYDVGSSCADTMKISIAPPPVADAGPDQNMTCLITNATIGTTAIPGNTYLWSNGITTATQTVTPSATTSYTVTVTNTASGCTATDVVTVNVNTTVPVADAGTDKTLTCTVTSTVIGTTAIAGNTYSWSPAAALSSTTNAQPTANPTATTTYTVTVTNTASGCTAADVVTVDVNTTVPVANAGPDQNLTCVVTSATIGTAAIAGNTYLWSNGITTAIQTVAPINNATYTVTVTNTASGCTATDVVLVKVEVTVPVADAGPDQNATCLVTNATIGSTAISGNTYLWSNGITTATQTVTPSATTTYTITVTNDLSGCTATDIVVVNVNTTPPLADAGTDKTLACTVTSTVIGTTAIVGNTYSWSPATALSSTTSAQPTANPTATTTYTVTVTNTASGCTATDVVTVNVNTTVPVADAGSDQNMTCLITNATIGTTAIPGNMYLWSNGITTATQTVTPSATTSYTVTVTNTASGCTATDVVTVNVNTTIPVADAGTDKTLTCTVTSTVIGTTAIVGNTYSWSPSTALSSTTSAQPTANPTATTTYTVTVTNTASGCTATDVVTVTVNGAFPVADAGSDQNINCLVTNSTIGTTAIAGNTYLWSNGITTATQTVTPSATTSYTVTVTNTLSSCTATDVVTVNVNTTVPVADAGSDQNMTCLVTNATIGTTAIPGNTYLWSNGITTATQTVTPSATTSYTVTVTNTASGCTATDVVTVNVNTTVPVADAGTDKTLTCTVTSTVIGTTALAGNTYSWSPATALSSTTSAQPTANPTATTTYTVTVTNTASGCTATDVVTVTVNGAFPVADAGSDQNINCLITNATIGTTAIAGNTYLWSNGITTATQTVTPSATTSYTVTVTNTLSSCTATDVVTVNVNTTLPVADAGSDQNMTCLITNATIGTTAIPGNTYLWSNGITTATQTVTPSATTSYTVTVTNTASGCTATDVVTVNVNTTIPVADAGVDQNMTCLITNATIGTTAIPGNTYLWSNGITTATQTVTPSATTSYTVTVTNTASGCTATDVITVSVNTTLPVADAGSDQIMTCLVTNATIGTTAIPGNTYLWSNGITTATQTVTPSATTSYTVTVTNTASGCTATDVVTVDVNTTIPIVAIMGDTSVCNGSLTTLTATGGGTYAWSTSAVTSSITVGVGTYTVTVTSSNGCTETASVSVINMEGSVGNYVWTDINGNGLQDEPVANGINGVIVELWKETSPNSGIYAMSQSTTTGNNGASNPGYYEFTICDSANYKVKFPINNAGNNLTSQSTTPGTDNNSDASLSDGFSPVFTIDPKGAGVTKDNATIDAGFVPPTPYGSLGNYVWTDFNANGLNDEGSTAGINGVKVYLFDNANSATPIDSMLTANNGSNPGYYVFDSLASGTYFVKFPTTNGTDKLTLQTTTVQTDNNSDANATTGNSPLVVIDANGSGQDKDNTTIDAGYFEPASLGNYVWNDLDQDGIQDANEVGVAGISVTLFDNGGSPISTTLTDAYGYYLFDNLLPSDYTVGFTLPQNYVFTSTTGTSETDALNSDVNTSTGNTTIVTLSSGEHQINVDAGIYFQPQITATVGNYVWFDTDADGIQDTGEVGISGVTVTLYDNTGNAVATTITDANGEYLFTNVTPGTYSVGFTSPVGMINSPNNGIVSGSTNSDANPLTGITSTFVVNAGDHITYVDAGFAQQPQITASLGDKVWYDVNQNGVQDASELGVEGVTVTLYQGNGTTVVATTTTDAFGNYIFNNLTAGQYVVGFTNLPTNYVLTSTSGTNVTTNSDANTVTAKTSIIDLSAGEHDMTWDAGIFNSIPANNNSIGDFVWNDVDKDGVQDAGEQGVPGITVTLYNNANVPIATTSTNANGQYVFPDLPNGVYSVGFSNLPTGFVFSPIGAGSSSTDSDPNPSTGLTSSVTLTGNTHITTLDAGINLGNPNVGTASLGDKVWYDINNNGLQDAGEAGVQGVTATLYGQNGTTVLATTTTNALGYYVFTGLNAGNYIVGFTNLPSGFTITSKNADTQGIEGEINSDVNTATQKTDVISLALGQDKMSVDMGIVTPTGTAALGDLVWYDLNNDGLQTNGEPGVQGVTVTLFDNTNTAIATTTTDANGEYHFVGLVPAIYSVGFSNLPSGYTFTTPSGAINDATNSDANPTTGLTSTVTLVAGDNNLNLDAGIKSTTVASVGDYVWYDINHDGIQDASEPGLGGILVTLYDNANNPVASTITNPDGSYIFTNVIPGTYTMGFGNLPTGMTFTTQESNPTSNTGSNVNPSTGLTPSFTVTAGTHNPSIDAGLTTSPLAGLGNYVWFDNNRDGVQGVNETGVAGAIATLYASNGTTVLAQAITDGNGAYSFTNLPAGDYIVGFSNLPLSYVATQSNGALNNATNSDMNPITGKTTAVTLLAGEYNPNLDAGIIKPIAQLGNYVWNDIDKDGIQDNTEVGVAGITVTLFDLSNTVISTTITDAYGYYKFSPLEEGTYHVAFTLPANYVFTLPHVASDSTDNDVNPITGITGDYIILAGDSNMTVDAGIYFEQPTIARVGNYVWLDINQDGTQNSGEEGISGVTVTLYNTAGDVVATMLTDANGFYLFSDVAPGTYTVGFTPPVGLTFSPNNNTLSHPSNSDANPLTGKTIPFTVNAGDDIMYVDAGLYSLANTVGALGDRVWYDTDQDGVQDSGEIGVEGVSVTLYQANGTTILATTTTDGFGNYIFNNLSQGQYVVGFEDLPTNYIFTTSTGTDSTTNSDANTVSGKTQIIQLAQGQYNLTIDAGIHTTVPSNTNSIGNYVWYDTNKDGIQDNSETGVSGVTVTLYDINNNVVTTTSTYADGYYVFPDLPNGTYHVGFSNLPSGFVFSPMGQGTPATDNNADPSTGKTATTTLVGNTHDMTLDAGINQGNTKIGKASLGDYVWYDLDNNGLQNANELGVQGVLVTLYDSDGTTVLKTTTTNSLGNYIFTGLDAGTYFVGFGNLPSGFTVSPQDADAEGLLGELNSDVNATTLKTSSIVLGTGEDKMSIDMGIVPPTGTAGLGNVVWFDLNNDGLQTNGEPGVQGVSVTLYNQSNQAIANTTTNSDGLYQFIGLAPGAYSVGFDNLPNGYTFTTKDVNVAGIQGATNSDANILTGMTDSIVLAIGDYNPNIDAGITSTTVASVGDYVWLDFNANGIQDTNETGIGGVLVTLIDNTNTPVASTITQPDGSYIFTNVIPGDYTMSFTTLPSSLTITIQETIPTSNTGSNPDPLTGITPVFSVLPGTHNPTIDAGLTPVPNAGLGNYVWYDVNYDGIQNSNEYGVPGVLVTLYDGIGNTALATAVTDGNGGYAFTNLPASTYVVGFTNLPLGYTRTTVVGNLQDSLNSDMLLTGKTNPVVLSNDEFNPNIDAGIYFGTPLASDIHTFIAQANGCDAQLLWIVTAESNTLQYEVMRTASGSTIPERIAIVPAKGNAQGEARYEYQDMNLTPGYYTYHINRITLDAKTTSTKKVTVHVDCGSQQPFFAIYPNPTTGNITVQISSDISDDYRINVRDLSGRIVLQTATQVSTNPELIQLNLDSFANGLYTIEVIGTYNQEVFKVKLTR